MIGRRVDTAARTLYDKLWQSHVVAEEGEGVSLLYIDRQLLHEVTSPQAFEGLRTRGIGVRRLAAQLAVADHAVPTRRDARAALQIDDPMARAQVARLVGNARDFAVPYIPLDDARHGIVHIIGPELGFTQPGMTLVCGDSHTSTHGAFGALAFGIGASECEFVLATQTLRQKRARNLRVQVAGRLASGVSAKDVALALIARIGSAGAVGCAIEYTGSAVRAMGMAARMTLCNMSIEAGARSGLVAPDDTTFGWLEGRPMAPRGAQWERALDHWRSLPSDAGAECERVLNFDADTLAPQVSWGTSPEQSLPIDACVPDPDACTDIAQRDKAARALAYMGLRAGMPLQTITIDHVFIGSCTNGRLEDLRAAAAVLTGRRVATGVRALAVPGSAQVKQAAEREGLDRIFLAAGFEWRSAGCSLCVAMNDDRLPPGARCASTSNRNFEGRQGVGARTHLMSPAMAASAAVAGRLCDVRDLS